jgi:hypothetical protein
MEDIFFDICVQVTVLSHFVEEEDERTCLCIVERMLEDKDFQKWTKGIDAQEVDHTATLFVRTYGSDIVSDIVQKLPLAMSKLMDRFDYLDLMNDLAKKEPQDQAYEQLYELV